MTHQTIIVLDFGSQYTQLIARRLRELSVYSEIWPPDTPLETIRARKPAGIILSGGPKSVSEPGAPKCDPGVYDIGSPVLGICYGMQLMAHALGGRVAPAPQREFGHATVTITGSAGRQRREAGDPAALFADVPDEIRVWASHGDFVAAAPDGLRGRRDERERADRRDVGPERGALRDPVSPGSRAHRTRPRDPAQLRLRRSAAAPATGRWRRLSRRRRRGFARRSASGRVVCALSGGVDSTVAALIIHRAVGDQLTCIFVDNGVLRLDEAAQIRKRFERLQLPLVFVDASTLFLDRLAGVTDPETEAEDHRRDVHRRVRGGGGEARPGRFPGAGHAVSRRHRIGRRSSGSRR